MKTHTNSKQVNENMFCLLFMNTDFGKGNKAMRITENFLRQNGCGPLSLNMVMRARIQLIIGKVNIIITISKGNIKYICNMMIVKIWFNLLVNLI